MQKLPPLEYKSLQSGLINEGAVSEFRIPTDAVVESINFDFDKLGSATLRKGLTRLGDDSFSGNILGLHEFRDSGTGTNNRIVMVNGTTAYYLSSGIWTSKRTGLTTGLKARFTTFLDFLWMVNGTDATAIWSGASGDSFITTGNAASAPIGKFIENFRSRVWIAGNSTYPDRIYFSSLPSAETTPVITWNTNVTTGDWIDISPSDGENITAIKRHKLSLLVFKNNHIYRIYSVAATDPDPTINVGTYSQESVVEAKNGVYFHHPTGFFRYSDGAAIEISKPIQDIVDNISAANYGDIAGWEDGDHIYWSLGNVTINDVVYSNLVVRYTISSETWTHRSYPTQFLNSSQYNDGSSIFQLVGDNDGNIYKTNIGLDDDGTPIFYSLITRWNNLDGTSSTTKTINKIMFLHDRGAGGNISFQTEDLNSDEWKDVLQLQNHDTGTNTANIVGRKIRFRLYGQSSGGQFEFSGYEILNAFSEEITFS